MAAVAHSWDALRNAARPLASSSRAGPSMRSVRWASHVPTRGAIVFPGSPPPAPAAPGGQSSEDGSSSAAGASSSGSSSSKGGQSSGSASSSSTPKGTGNSSLLPKPRLDYGSLLSDPARTAHNAVLRNSRLPLGPNHLPHLVRLRDTQLLLLSKLSNVRSKQKEISGLIKAGLGVRDELVRQAKKLKGRIGEYEANLTATEDELLELSLVLPNWTAEGVPIGPEDNAVEMERFGPEITGEKEKQAVERDHLRIANHFDLLDNDASTLATGASWPYLRGTLALLELALVNYATSICIKRGYEPVIPPDVIRSDIASRCGFNPRDNDESQGAAAAAASAGAGAPTQTYSIANTDLCLAGTAEIPLSALFANRIFENRELPRKVVGVGHAFRAEAGARGADTRGLYRVHQFTKVEMFCVTTADGGESEGTMEDMRAVQKEIVDGLGLSVRVLDMPTEELGASAAKKYDMEAWMPGRGKWGEASPLLITSTSNCTDYQSRRLHIRYRPPITSESESAPLPFAHTLNGTAAAIPRLLVALLENGVRFKSGTTEHEIEGLDLPKALERFWVGTNEIGTGKNRGEIRWI